MNEEKKSNIDIFKYPLKLKTEVNNNTNLSQLLDNFTLSEAEILDPFS